ncbi:MAG: hypothetical protein KDC40_13860, partial [Actinobacteria bacterium]|nr:hypothetical protein [Actinomycetota bacterium]
MFSDSKVVPSSPFCIRSTVSGGLGHGFLESRVADQEDEFTVVVEAVRVGLDRGVGRTHRFKIIGDAFVVDVLGQVGVGRQNCDPAHPLGWDVPGGAFGDLQQLPDDSFHGQVAGVVHHPDGDECEDDGEGCGERRQHLPPHGKPPE